MTVAPTGSRERSTRHRSRATELSAVAAGARSWQPAERGCGSRRPARRSRRRALAQLGRARRRVRRMAATAGWATCAASPARLRRRWRPTRPRDRRARRAVIRALPSTASLDAAGPRRRCAVRSHSSHQLRPSRRAPSTHLLDPLRVTCARPPISLDRARAATSASSDGNRGVADHRRPPTAAPTRRRARRLAGPRRSQLRCVPCGQHEVDRRASASDGNSHLVQPRSADLAAIGTIGRSAAARAWHPARSSDGRSHRATSRARRP